MNHRKIVSRLLLGSVALFGLGYTKGTSTCFSYYAYTTEIANKNRFMMGLDVWNETSSVITVNAYEFAVYSGSGTLLTSRGENRTNGYPRTLAKGDAPIQLKFYFTPGGEFEIHAHVYGQVKTQSQIISMNFKITPGAKFTTESTPLVITESTEFAPKRSEYDFNTHPRTKTYKYRFYGVEDLGRPYIAAFNIDIYKQWEESQKYSLPAISDARLVVHSHAKEYRNVADSFDVSSGDCTFLLNPVQESRKTRFELANPIYMDMGTGVVSHGSIPSARQTRTYRLPLPHGVEESSTDYSWDLTFKMDNDYVRIPLSQTNRHVGLGNPDAKYMVVLG